MSALVHAIVGNFVEPKVFGDSLELHPVVVNLLIVKRFRGCMILPLVFIKVLLSLAFWFALWGMAGAILSVSVFLSALTIQHCRK